MTRAIIIDDEQHCINRLSKMLKESNHDLLLMDSFQSVEDGVTGIKKLHPDLVFLDVQINDKTGFDLLQQIPTIHFEVIFTTAYERYAVQAFKFSALDYLLKPIDEDDLAKALNKLKEKVAVKEHAARFDTLFHNLKNIQGAGKRICIPVTSGLEFIEVSDIIRCQSDVNYTTLFLKDKQKLVVAKTLKEFEEMLSDFNFYRVHNSHLINLTFIKSYNKGKGGFVTMKDNTDIEVSTRRKDEFLKRLSGM